MPKPDKTPDVVPIASNRRARHHYDVLETFEAGLALKGPEVKSLRLGRAQLEGAFARVDGGELFLHNLHIAPYAQNTLDPLEPARTRKLLVHRGEVKRLSGRLESKGLTLVPLELYFRRGWAKVSLALARGRRGPDRRDAIRERESEREVARAFRKRR